MTPFILNENIKQSVMSLKKNYLQNIINSTEPLTVLRQLYKNDIDQFYNTRDELMLRGINLEKEYQSNFFPFIDCSNSPKIIVTSDNNYYQRIDFNLLNIPDFIQKFKVESDLFFNEIPIQGLISLSKGISIQYVSTIFQNAGFAVSKLPADYPYLTETSESPKITEIFPKADFLSFHKFCKDNEYLTLFDLSLDKINKFIDQPQVGTIKVQKVIEKYLTYLSDTSPPSQEQIINKNLEFFAKNGLKTTCEKYNINYFELLNELYSEEQYVDYSSNSININNLVQDFITYKIEAGKDKVLEEIYQEYESQLYSVYLGKIELSTIKKIMIKKNINSVWPAYDPDLRLEELTFNINNLKIYHDLINFQQNLPSLNVQINQIKAQIKERDLKCFVLRNVHDLTLQSIAEQLELTRERVRQIIKKVESTIIKLTKTTDLSVLLEVFSKQLTDLTKKRIMNFFSIQSPEDFIIFQSMMKATQNFHYHKLLEVYATKEEINLLDKKVAEIDQLSPILTGDEIKAYFNISNSADQKDTEIIKSLQQILYSKGYTKSGEVYIKNSVSLKDKFNYLFKYYIPYPLKVDREGSLRLSLLMTRVFGSCFSDNQRAITARIRDAENIILTDPLTFGYFDPSSLDENFVFEIKNAIKQSLLLKDYVNVKEIYEFNRDLMRRNQIKSKLHLYSLTQYFLNDDFDIGKGNTLNIYKSNVIKHNSEELLESLLNNNTQKMSKQKALEILQWPSYKLDQLIGESHKFISLDSKDVALFSSLNVLDCDKAKILLCFEKELSSGFSFCYDIYQDMQFDDEMGLILKKYNIKNHYELIQVVKKLTTKFKGHSNFIFLENSTINSLEKFLVKEFPDSTSRKEIYDFILLKGYSEQTAQGTLRELMINRSFVELDRISILNRKVISFDSNLKNILKQYLDKEFGQELFLSVFNLVGFKHQLPALNIGNWTKHLIYNLGIELGYTAIKTTADYRYDKLVLVKPDTSFTQYDELIHYILKNKYQGSLYEPDVANFLARSGLSHNKEKLVFDLKVSPLFAIDNFGWITLK